MNISPPAASLPSAPPIPRPRSQAPRTAQSQLQALLDKVAEHIKNEITSDSAMRSADLQNENRYVAYLNEQRPGLNLHKMDAVESMELEVNRSIRSGASHTRFLIRDNPGRRRYYMEFRHPQDAPPSVIVFNHEGFAREDRANRTLNAFRRQIQDFEDFEEIWFMQVDTFKQANECDTVMFAAHSAWVALDHTEDYGKLHDMALTGVEHTRDEGRYCPSIQPQLFPDSFYEYEQLRNATPPDIDKLPGNFMSIFEFRQQLLTGVMAMSHTPA